MDVVLEGKIPVAPHLFYTQFLVGSQKGERQVGLDLGIKELRGADEFLLHYMLANQRGDAAGNLPGSKGQKARKGSAYDP